MNPLNTWAYRLKKAMDPETSSIEKSLFLEQLLREHGGELIRQRRSAQRLFGLANKATNPAIRAAAQMAFEATGEAIKRSEDCRDVLRELIAQLRRDEAAGDGWGTTLP
jgi:hypothetical protein